MFVTCLLEGGVEVELVKYFDDWNDSGSAGDLCKRNFWHHWLRRAEVSYWARYDRYDKYDRGL